MKAYIKKSEDNFETDDAAVTFWMELLEKTGDEANEIKDTPVMDNLVRMRLAKKRGIGYVQPSEDTFPAAGEFAGWVSSCGAIPMITWVDGTSDGEQDPYPQFECLIDQPQRKVTGQRTDDAVHR